MSSSAPTKLPRLLQRLIILFILAIALVQVIPSYIDGSWIWAKPPQVSTIKQLRDLEAEGLSYPQEWTVLEQQTVRIGGHDWSIQSLDPSSSAIPEALRSPAIVMLRPQTNSKQQPQVEWTDINGSQRWTVDQRQTLTFSVDTEAESVANITAQFFRGWNREQTYAVLQWYAWVGGGHPSPARWFWSDVMTQLHTRQRMPWVAVSLLIPIKPLGNIESAQPVAELLGQTVQALLMQGPLKLS